VLVDFIDADMDQPIVVGQLYNGVDTPPFAAGVGRRTAVLWQW
jgi:type VI secretion system secreted protein VgrG